jgi:radical SAM superfamily enzyme YgiQ (UPF0313 family)
MKKILLTHSYFLRFDPKQWETGRPYPPIGTLYAASLMRQKGYPVRFFDTMFAQDASDIEPVLASQSNGIFVIYDDGFNYLTKMCLTNMRNAAFQMIQLAKEMGFTVLVSSSDSTDQFESYLEQGADFVLLGEAEQSLSELCDAISRGDKDYSGIPGLAFKTTTAIIKTAKRPVLRDLDSLPFPAWDLVDIEPYRRMWMKSTGYFSLNIATTRGCPFKCNWCAKPIYGNRYNTRSPENVVEEMKLLKRIFHIDHIWFCDDIFGLKPGWVQQFADLIEQQDLHIRFKIQARVDLLMQENYIRDLRRAGCENVWMGAESGSQKILDAMDKGTTVEQIYGATRLLKKHGIHPSFFIQFGYPGETREDITRTIQMINRLLPYEIGISVSYPLPGTPFYERVRNELRTKTNWTDSDELALLFRNTYGPSFYKQLHRYVHKSYRKHLALQQLRMTLSNPLRSRAIAIKKILSLAYYAPAAWIDKLKLRTLEHSTA